MPWWMKRGGYCDEAGDGTDGSAVGGGVGEGDLQSASDGGAGVDGGGKSAQPVEAAMLAAITEKVPAADGDRTGEPEAGGDGQPRDPATGRFTGKPGEAQQQAQPQGQQRPAQAPQAQGQQPPKLGPDGKPAGEQQQQGQQKATPKKADDYALTAEDKKTLTPNQQRRVHEVVTAWKDSETRWTAEREQLSQTNQQLMQVRDTILGVMEETKTSDEDLAQLLNFNLLVKSGRYDDALAVLDQQRAAIAEMAGRDVPGVDLLARHPDLAARVEAQTLAREDAIALANARNTQARTQQQQAAQGQVQQQEQDARRAQDAALDSITRWTQQIAAKDIDYRAKEAKLIEKIERIVKTYPANLWLTRIQEAYEDLPGAPQGQQNSNNDVPGAGGNMPLRPSGAKGGQRQPADMFEAIAQGLNYQHLT